MHVVETLDHIAAERCQIKALRLKCAVVAQRAPSIHSSVSTSRAVWSQSTWAHGSRHPRECSPPFRKQRRLQPEIHFDCDRAGKCRHHFDQPEPARFGGESFRLACRKKKLQIRLEPAFDARTENLDGDRFARAVHVDLRAMYLCNRCRGDRRTEACIGGGKRFAEGGHNGCLRLALRERRHLVLKTFQVARDRRAHHIRPRRRTNWPSLT